MHHRLIYYLAIIPILCQHQLAAQNQIFDEQAFWKAFEQSSWSEVSDHVPCWKTNKAYPAVWRAAGYAALKQSHYTQSAEYYRRALCLNSYDTLSLVTLAWNLTELGEPLKAGSLAKNLDTYQKSRAGIQEKPIFQAVDVEGSLKWPASSDRDASRYFKIALHSLPASNLAWSNHFSLFSQNVRIPIQVPRPPSKPGAPPSAEFITLYDSLLIKQWQWHSSLRYALGPRLEFVLPFNLIGTSAGSNKYKGLSAGLLADFRVLSFKFSVGTQYFNFNDSSFVQPSLIITHFPLHHAGFYYGLKSCMIFSNSSKPLLNGLFAGGKIGKMVWLEAFFLFGKFRNLLDQDGLYLYNTFDAGKWRGGISFHLKSKWKIQPAFCLGIDQFSSYLTGTSYLQKNFTTTITWKH